MQARVCPAQLLHPIVGKVLHPSNMQNRTVAAALRSPLRSNHVMLLRAAPPHGALVRLLAALAELHSAMPGAMVRHLKYAQLVRAALHRYCALPWLQALCPAFIPGRDAASSRVAFEPLLCAAAGSVQ